LRIGNADQAQPMAALPQRMAEGGHRVEMAAGGGAEQAVVGHGRDTREEDLGGQFVAGMLKISGGQKR